MNGISKYTQLWNSTLNKLILFFIFIRNEELMGLNVVSFVAHHFSCTFVMADMMGIKRSCDVDVLKAMINGNYLLNISLKTNKDD